MKKKLILLLSLIYSLSLSAQIKYVTPSGSGSKDGSSWGNAKDSSSLKSVLDASSSGDTIWVAAGTYWPTDGTSRNEYFEIKDSVKVFGGFAGYELVGYNLALRDFSTNQTILSGDIGSPGVASDNSYHVVYTQNVSATTVLDGFTIQDGNANNNTFPEERGGGWFNTGRYVSNNSSPTINNCIFKNNYALNKGGALCNDGYEGNASPILSNCSFINNSSETSTSGKGGAIYNEGLAGNSNPSFTNCLFYNNTAYQGGGVFNDGNAQSQDGHSNPTFSNCTFYNNGRTNSDFGEAIFSESADNGSEVGESITNFKNSILWGENTFYKSFSIVGSSKAELYSSLVREIDCAALNTDGVATFHGSGNLFAQNPIFVDSTNGNLRLQNISPAVNMGDNSLVNWKSDIVEKLRIRGGTVDMGAFENQNSTTLMYVDQGQTTGNNNGSSWANAFTNLQDALTLAIPNDSIWVAAGTYKPTTGTDRTISFHIPDNVKIYGGLEGNEAINYNLANRNYTSNETILSGNIGLSDSTSDNSYHVVYTINCSPSTVIDGFTIKGGNADGSSINGYGGGWYNDGSSGYNSSPSLMNIAFSDNNAKYGGAMYNNANGDFYFIIYYGISNPTLTNCSFSENTASFSGGAMFNDGYYGTSSPTLTNCSFSENTANGSGGAMYNVGNYGTSSLTLTNCSFSANTADGTGGAMYIFGDNGNISCILTNCIFDSNGNDHIGYDDGNANTQPHFINCTFTGADSSAINIEFWDSGKNPIDFTNCIFWDNEKILGGNAGTDNARLNIINSIVEDAAFATSSNNNINQDPLFLNAAIGNFNLQATSPAINTGLSDSVKVSTDLAGAPRIRGNDVDMGAFENQNGTTLMYVDQGQTTGNNNGSSWAHAFTDLQDALTLATPNDSIWVAAGTYKPTSSSDRTITFQIPDSVKVYGGFKGNELKTTNLTLRNFKDHETILSGDIGLSDSTSDNSLNIVLLENVSEQTVIDGFTITEAYDNSYQIRSGGLTIVAEGLGTASKPIVTNCHITKNETDKGAGITILGYAQAEASPALSHCVLDSNKATIFGGGLYARAFENGISHLSISNSTFNDNNANGSGAGLYLSSGLASTSSFNLSNSFIQGNTAGSFGGGVYISAYDAKFNPTFRNCVITGNYATSKGAAIFLYAAKSYEDDPEAKLELINCTIAINAADPLATNSSSGIDISVGEGVDAQPTITNTIIYENGTSANDNFKISNGQSPSITYSYITGLTVAGTADSNISYQNNPYIQFVDESITAPSSKGNFAITGCEATWGANTFNKGDNTAAGSFDIRNKARIFNSRVDLGAYEYDGEGLLSHDDIEYFDSFEKLQVNSIQHAPNDSHLSATKSIELLPGFEAEQGAIFKAEINSEMCIP